MGVILILIVAPRNLYILGRRVMRLYLLTFPLSPFYGGRQLPRHARSLARYSADLLKARAQFPNPTVRVRFKNFRRKFSTPTALLIFRFLISPPTSNLVIFPFVYSPWLEKRRNYPTILELERPMRASLVKLSQWGFGLVFNS